MREKNPMRKNNKGLTLIELVVTVAIIAIFSGIVLSIVGTSSNSFRTTSSTAKVQMKTQELLDTIQDLVIDANRSVYYEIGDKKIENDIDGPEANMADMLSQRTFYVCNGKPVPESHGKQEELEYDILRWDPLTKEVRYSHAGPIISGDSDGSESPSEETSSFAETEELTGNSDDVLSSGSDGDLEIENKYSVIAENVISFRADVTKVKGLRIVRFRIVMNEKGKEITTLHTVNLRNEIQVAPPDPNLPSVPEYSFGISIEPDVIFTWPIGKTFEYFVARPNGDYDPLSIKWSYETDVADMTVLLKEKDNPVYDKTQASISANRPGKVKVIVSVCNPEGEEKSAFTYIEFIEVQQETIKVEIIEEPKDSLVAKAGDDFELKARITEGTLSEVVSWTAVPYSEGEDPGKISIVWDNELNAKLNVENPGSVLVTITVKNANGDTATDEAIVTVEKDETPSELKIDGPIYVTAEEIYKIWDTWKLVDGTGKEVIISANNAEWTCNDSSVSITPSGWDKDANLKTSASTKEFELKLKVNEFMYPGPSNDKPLVLTYNVKVVKLTDLAPAEETHKIGDTVNFTPTVTVADVPVGANDPVFKELSSNWKLNDVAQSGLNWGQTASWTIDEDALTENKITLQMILDGRKVYCPNGTPDIRTRTSVVKVEEIEFQLKLEGPLAIEVEEDGARKNLSDYTVNKVVEGQPDEKYKGTVTWKCSGNDYVTIVNGQIVINPAAWTDPEGPGTFELWATAQRLDGTEVVSNTLTVSIVRIKIVTPLDGAIVKQGDEVVVVVEYYAGDTFVRKFELYLDNEITLNRFRATELGVHTIKVEGNELGLPVSDSVNIEVLEELHYTIWGSDIMPDTVARIDAEQKYICNQYPDNLATEAQKSRTYWVENNHGEFVDAEMTVVDNGDTVVFTAVINDKLGTHVVTKTVNVVSVIITKPEGVQLSQNTTYVCEAQLTYGTTDNYNWSVTGGTGAYQGNIYSVKTSSDKNQKLVLDVTTNVTMKHKKGEWPNYKISDSRSYSVQDEALASKWKVEITQVDDNDDGIIHIPLNNKGESATYVSALVTNNGEKDHTTNATGFVWKLFIPELNLWIENGRKIGDKGPGKATFPEGSGAEGAYHGLVEIEKWTFPKEILRQSLPGILYVECVPQNGKRVFANRNVTCVLDGLIETMP